MGGRIEKPLKVGKVDVYSLTVSREWLNGESISSFTVNTDATKITVGATSISDNVLLVYLTGVESERNVELHFNYATLTRTDCDSVYVTVEEC